VSNCSSGQSGFSDHLSIASEGSNAIASTSRGPSYLNVPAITSSSNDQAEADISPITSPTRQLTETCTKFLSRPSEVVGQAIPKEQWQADSSSALCSYPLCTTNFGPAGHYSGYFTLQPRRHHCRKCGQLFCGEHSTQRAPLARVSGGKRVVAKERVCDTCLPRTSETPITSRSRRSSAWSQSSQSTLPSDTIVTPDQEDSGFVTASIVLSQTSSLSRSSTRGNLEVSVEPTDKLAPLEPWMGNEGVLSLYPLAVNPSHAAKEQRAALQPAAGPLFGPSLAARRTALEKELERTSLRQRRLGADKSFWIPGAWGYRREDFDPTFHDEDVEGEVFAEGGLVVDGPIRFRASARRLASPARTPSEERPQMDLSAF
jgi:hypothetical protein